MKTLTNQEIFDKILNHLRKQGKASISDGGKCMYRGDNGNSCAVGCLISDEDYLESFDIPNDSDVTSMLKNLKFKQALINSGIDITNDKTMTLLIEMQSAHDTAVFRDYWLYQFNESMQCVAVAHNLTYTDSK